MRYIIDTSAGTLERVGTDDPATLDLYSSEAFAALSRLWVDVGWELRYSYQFSWLGRPVIQLPEDLLVIQQLIHDVRPDVIVETGVAHGGSLVFHATLCRAMEHGRVVGVDIEIRPHNRKAIESHPLADLITLIEGSSTAEETLDQVRACIGADDVVLVILDSDHSRDHVAAELHAYAPLVSPGSYLVVTDGVMVDVAHVPSGSPSWSEDNPLVAADAFLGAHDEFQLVEPPPRPFDESAGLDRATYWPRAFLRRSAAG